MGASLTTVARRIAASLTVLAALSVLAGCRSPSDAPSIWTDVEPKVFTVQAPVFSHAAGTYTADLSVTITCATSGAVIYYTTDGTDPTTSSPVYSGAISVVGNETTMTVKAFAVASGRTDSGIVGASYAIHYSGSLDTTFDPGTGADGAVRAIAVQDDGRILIGGTFTTYYGTPRGHVARVNADGSLDTGFDPGTGADYEADALAIQSDGRIFLCGIFTTYNGASRERVARLNANGSLDTSFDPGTGADFAVFAIVVQNDGKILIGGNFLTYNGITCNHMARLNADGSLDTAFDSSIGANNTVYSLAVQSDGKILVGGDFTTYNGTTRNYLARLWP